MAQIGVRIASSGVFVNPHFAPNNQKMEADYCNVLESGPPQKLRACYLKAGIFLGGRTFLARTLLSTLERFFGGGGGGSDARCASLGP